MAWEKLLGAIVDLLTKGWPAAFLVAVVVLRRPLVRLLGRVESAEAGTVKINLRAAQRAGDGSDLLPAATELKQLPSETSASSGPAQSADDPWRRCGNIYWLANNTVFAALAILGGDQELAIRELDNAIHHARQLPLEDARIGTLRELLKRLRVTPNDEFFDKDDWSKIVQELVQVGSLMGRFVAHQQSDFPQRDIRSR